MVVHAGAVAGADVFTNQREYPLRFGWGGEDLAVLARAGCVLVVVDVLRFSTAVSVAVARGARVWPYRWRDASARGFAVEHGAALAGSRDDPSSRWSLSPARLTAIPAGTRLVLTSPNGATLSARAQELGAAAVIAGCLRNAAAVGRWLAERISAGQAVAVIAAGERWPDPSGTPHLGPLRPAVEDLLGAGGIIARTVDAGGLPTSAVSPEARAAMAAFRAAAADLPGELMASASGQELRARGWDDDVLCAARADTDDVVPILRDGAYERSAAGS
ncbi:2-phosphosulfolactate phosphatase [Parafrankia sp. EUN1f]|uniref:2-phosphosulfolactate phosphatase n=1 Tax=Parafrankia sp. EUN1f TaxID=102897 RepID=UPI001E65830F|nr:2-phosphosulfolactate phosphatase [Parafrankia sp. EUN1f]